MPLMPIQDVSLFVKVLGHGYPMVLMHGGPGLDHTILLSFRPSAKHFNLAFYDHRCNGRSVGADVSTMTWDNLTADAEALRQALGFDKWSVLGPALVVLVTPFASPQVVFLMSTILVVILTLTAGFVLRLPKSLPVDPPIPAATAGR